MTVLTMIQNVADELGLSRPSSVISNSTAQVKQLLQVANREGQALAKRGRWSAMIRENTFTITAAASQGALNGTVISDSDYLYMINGTMWNRTTDMPIIGPVSSAQWQTLQAFPVTGPYQQWMIRGKNLYLDPVPTATDSAAFDYMSSSWCESAGGAGQRTWQADTDVGLLDEDLMGLGIIWRWKRRIGADYSEEFMEYERQVMTDLGRDGGAETLHLDNAQGTRQAGIVIPIGSWNV